MFPIKEWGLEPHWDPQSTACLARPAADDLLDICTLNLSVPKLDEASVASLDAAPVAWFVLGICFHVATTPG